MKFKTCLFATCCWLLILLAGNVTVAKEPRSAQLPGATDQPLGTFKLEAMELEPKLECDKGILVVPENRTNEKSRGITLHFYRIKSRAKGGSKLPPVAFLPGGPWRT